MGWKDLLQDKDEIVVYPWTGGREIRVASRKWRIEGRLPREHGWYAFNASSRTAQLRDPGGPPTGGDLAWDPLDRTVSGFLVGDRMVPDGAVVNPDISLVAEASERVYLIEDGLERFARVTAGRKYGGGPLIYEGQAFPLGPEDAVARAFQDRMSSVDHVKGVTPALDAAFRMETHQRTEADRLRVEMERRRAEEAARAAEDERRRELYGRLTDGAARREIAQYDFEPAARAALADGDAELLDQRPGQRGEVVVTYRLDGRRYQCVCDARTLSIIDAGVCLNDYRTGQSGDTWFTLESLPGVIREADRLGRLVVFRRVDDDYPEDDY